MAVWDHGKNALWHAYAVVDGHYYRSALVNCQSHATFLFMTIEYTAAPMNVTNRIPQP